MPAREPLAPKDDRVLLLPGGVVLVTDLDRPDVIIGRLSFSPRLMDWFFVFTLRALTLADMSAASTICSLICSSFSAISPKSWIERTLMLTSPPARCFASSSKSLKCRVIKMIMSVSGFVLSTSPPRPNMPLKGLGSGGTRKFAQQLTAVGLSQKLPLCSADGLPFLHACDETIRTHVHIHTNTHACI